MGIEETRLGLAARLRQGTALAHREAESAAFIKQFFKGQLKQREYANFLAGLYPVYAAMEEALTERPTHPVLGPFHLPGMFRCPALASDLEHFLGPDWRRSVGARPGSCAYAARVRKVGSSEPPLLVAHIYTRYLGDLSGGQIMGKVTQRALGLETEAGLSFYRFDAIGDADSFKDRFRAKLDRLAVDEAMRQRIVEEAVHSFGLNHALTQEVTLAA